MKVNNLLVKDYKQTRMQILKRYKVKAKLRLC